MRIESYFENIQEEISSRLDKATSSVRIAVAWFTNQDLFDSVLDCCRRGLSVTLVILNDDINRGCNLNFQELIDLGCELMMSGMERLMHNKYCIIDNQVVITGSYNYTNNAEAGNLENIVILEHKDTVKRFMMNFETVLKHCDPVSDLEEYLEENPPSENVFASSEYGVRDSYVARKPMIAPPVRNSGQRTHIPNKKSVAVPAPTVAQSRSRIQESQNDVDGYLIRRPIYRQWKEDYYVTRVECHDGLLAITFKTFVSDGCFIHGPSTEQAWRISLPGRSYSRHCIAIQDITISGRIVCREAEKGKIYWFLTEEHTDECEEIGGYIKKEGKIYDSRGNQLEIETIHAKENASLTCKIIFKSNGYQDAVIDLYEGKYEHKKDDNWWHAFAIDLTKGRE